MKPYRLERRQLLPITADEAWDFFSQPLNLPLITPPRLDFVVTSPVPKRMRAGTIVSYRLRPLFGIPLTWVSEITQVQEPSYFVDEQKFGPYRFWHHAHVFEPTKNGIDMRDIVHYHPGYGLLGRWIHLILLRDRLKNIFDYRKEALIRIFVDGRRPHATGKHLETRSGGSAQRGAQLV
jgi:ligand-binding SRPBCC domain-containing protein